MQRPVACLAAGAHRRAPVRSLLEAPTSERFPGTALRSHPDVTLIVDAEAHLAA